MSAMLRCSQLAQRAGCLPKPLVPAPALCAHSRKQGVRRAPAARPQAARRDTVTVWETLVVMSSEPSTSGAGGGDDASKELLDTLWSLQYHTPGACCASAGKVATLVAPAPGGQAAAAGGAAPTTQAATASGAVYYRFASQQQAERFIAGPAFAKAKAEVLQGGAVLQLLLWKVLVPNDMEALFKRGPAFDTGLDMVMLLAPVPGAAPNAAVAVVAELQAAALQAETGAAVQVSAGFDLLSMDERYVVMARFAEEAHLRAFMAGTPAVRDMLQQRQQPGAGGGSAAQLLAVYAVQVGNVEEQNSRAV